MSPTAGEMAVTGRVVVIGAGLAALSAALRLAPRPVLVISPEELGAGASSAWAQGGVAAAIGPGDSPEDHAAQAEAAERSASAVPEAVRSRLAAAEQEAEEMMTRVGDRIRAAAAMAEQAASDRAEAARAAGRRVLGAATEAGAAATTPAVKAASGAGSAMVDGLAKAHRRAADFIASRIRQDIEAQRELLACRSLEEVREVQSRYFKSAMEQYTAETREMVQLGSEVASKALDKKGES